MNDKNNEEVYNNIAQSNVNTTGWFEWIPARVVLYLLALNNVAIMYMIRITISLTMVAMVKEIPNNQTFNVTETLCFDNSNHTYVVANDYEGTLDWSVNQQYYALTSFYWTYLLSHTFSGIFAQKYGTKKILGWSVVVSSLSQLCVPFTSTIHYTIVVALQLIQGLSQGFILPALYSSIGVWIPTKERSRFVTCFKGSALGITIISVVAGFIIAEFGWVYVFYATGGLGLLSALLWYLLMHDKPEQHPRISRQELNYIQENREQGLHSEKAIPWYSILTSLPVWAIGVSAFGRMWILAIFTTYCPLYFKTMFGVSVENIGLIIGVCTFIGYLSSFLFAIVSDKIVTNNLMSLLYNRKMLTVIGQILAGFLTLAMGYVTNCDIPLILTLYYLIQFFLMANFVGTMSNIVDISPSHAGPVSSFVQIILLVPNVLSTYVLKTFLENENNLLPWRYAYCIACGVIIITAMFYAIFASAKVQPWDVPKSFRNLPDANVGKRLLKDLQSE